MGSAGPRATALALLRSWRRNRLRSASALGAIAIGGALLTLVTALSLSIVQSLGQASGLDVLDAELVVVARATSGLPEDAIGELAAVPGVRRTAPAVIVSSRVAGRGQDGNLTVVGLTPAAAELAPDLLPTDVAAPQPNTYGLLVTADWARRMDKQVGDVIELTSPGGGADWTIVATVDSDVTTGPAMAVGQLDEVRDAFQRGDGVDAVFVQADRDADTGDLTTRLEGVAHGRATVGPPSSAVATVVASFAVVRSVLYLVAGVGIMVGIAVVYVCWRLQLLHDRAILARLRLVGARSRQLALGALVVFLVVTAGAIGIGIPLGLLGARVLGDFSVQLASISGYAVEPSDPPLFVPALVGAVGALVMGGAAWVIALRPVLRVPAIEAVVDRAAPQSVRERSLTPLAVGLGLVALSAVLVAALPVSGQPLVLVLILVSTIVLARTVPPAVGRLLSRRDDVPVRLSARHYQIAIRQTAATTTILIVALTFALGLGGLSAGAARGIDQSIEAWTGGDLYVQAGEPGTTVRDQKLDAALTDRLEDIPGITEVSPFNLNQVNVDGRLVPLYSWNPDPEELQGFVDLDVADGAEGDRFWEELAAGNVAVTENFARQHDLDIGDELTLPTPDGAVTPTVTSLVSDFLSDSGILYSSIDLAEQVAGDRRAAGAGLRLAPGADVDEVTRQVREVAQEDQPGAIVWTGARMQDHLRQMAGQLLLTLRLLSGAIELLAVIVAYTTVVATVSSRQREYGLVGLCGANERTIKRQLSTEYLGLGVLSWIIAATLGLLVIGPLMAFVALGTGMELPFAVPTLDLGVALVVALAASVLAVWAPARALLRRPLVELIAVGE